MQYRNPLPAHPIGRGFFCISGSARSAGHSASFAAEIFQDISGVRVGLYLAHNLFDNAFLVYDECRSHNTHAYLSVKLFLLPHAISFYSFALGVGEKNERKRVLSGKFRVRCRAVPAYPDDGDTELSELRIFRRERAGLSCAALGIVLRVEIYDRPVSREVRQ